MPEKLKFENESRTHVANTMGEAWKWKECRPGFEEVATCVAKAMERIHRETIEECVKIMHSISTPDDKDIDTFIEQFPGEICREQAIVFMIQNATEIAFDAFAKDQP